MRQGPFALTAGAVTAYRAEDWGNYDRVALAQAFAADSAGAQDLVGPALRAYWLTYPGVTHLRVALRRDLFRGLGLTVVGDNLLNHQAGEPDNITVLRGRTIQFGLSGAF